MLQTTSTERRAAGGHRPRSGGSVKMRPWVLRSRSFLDISTRSCDVAPDRNRSIMKHADPSIGGIERILLIRLKAIGDVVFTLPAVHALHEIFPHAEISFLTSTEHAPILRGFGGVHKILTVDRSLYKRMAIPAIWNHTLALIGTLRRARYDLVVDFQGYGETALLARLTGAPRRWGMTRDGFRKRAFTRRVVCDHRRHPAVWNRLLLAECGLDLPSLCNRFVLSDDGVKEALAFFHANSCDPDRPVLFIQPFTSSPFKTWPLDRFVELGRAFRGRDVQVIFGGGPGNREALEPVRGAGFPVSAGLSLLASAGLVKLSTVTVGGDTGLLHLAVAMGKRVVMLMESVGPGSATPLGHEEWVVLPGTPSGTASIQLGEVIAACERALREYAAPPGVSA